MSTTFVGKGGCLCGKVKVTARKLGREVGVCHCGICRKWGGGPFFALEGGTDVSFDGEDNIAVYPSSDWAERGFCRHCGTHLFYRLKENRLHFLPTGIFDNAENLVFTQQVFIDAKPAYYAFANKTQNMTGEELFAQYAPK